MAKQRTTYRRRGFSSYRGYVSDLKKLAAAPANVADWKEQAVAALDGEASLELRKSATLNTRRRYGAFFTGSSLAADVISRCTEINARSVVYDPTVGMGDLLLAAARRLGIGRTMKETFKQWGRRLAGTDIHAEFVDGAKTRLAILAQQLHGLEASGIKSTAGLFPRIRLADGLNARRAYGRATHLILNPPFVKAKAPVSCDWASGRVTQASAFVVTALEHAKPGTELVAILPDVLRSGSFAEKWRKRVEELATVCLVEPYGIFDESADVDVFILRVRRKSKSSNRRSTRWMNTRVKARKTVGDDFDVHVGRVVPHRDPEEGERHPYIHARSVLAWETMRKFTESRRHKGEAYITPFVAVRRTSRPGDRHRATGTIIRGKQAIAVENHLIVCQPKNGKLQTCRKLLRKLKSAKVNKFLDTRIRCRHLTVAAIREIPL
jgi:hypothetical protein